MLDNPSDESQSEFLELMEESLILYDCFLGINSRNVARNRKIITLRMLQNLFQELLIALTKIARGNGIYAFGSTIGKKWKKRLIYHILQAKEELQC